MKREDQQRLLSDRKMTDEEKRIQFFTVLRLVAPGTHLRTALNGALKTGKGALIAVDNGLLDNIIDGGFKINCRFTPQKLIELTKLDGAIILSKDMKKIKYANVLLTPESKIKSDETGTRHRAAERTAKQTGTLVIAVSERRNEITTYYGNKKHLIISSDELLRKANEYIQMLEKQRDLFDRHIEKLNYFELRNYNSLNNALNVIQKGSLVQMISKDLQEYIIELGKEGVLLKTRLKEIVSGVERETDLVIKDYTKLDLKKTKALLEDLTYDEILEKENILGTMGYENLLAEAKVVDTKIKGWRMLSKTSLSEPEIANLVKKTESFDKLLLSEPQFYKEVLGEKADSFTEELSRLKMNI